MPNIWRKKIATPFTRLLGVLFFMLLLQFLTLEFKCLAVALIMFLAAVTHSVSVLKIFQNWYRFKYLLLSIAGFNYYFSHSLATALDKVLLLLAMLSLVNMYMQFENKKHMLSALERVFLPLKIFGLKPEPMAVLLRETLSAVEAFKFSFKNEQSHSNVTVSITAVAKRLAQVIRDVEQNVVLESKS